MGVVWPTSRSRRDGYRANASQGGLSGPRTSQTTPAKPTDHLSGDSTRREESDQSSRRPVTRPAEHGSVDMTARLVPERF